MTRNEARKKASALAGACAPTSQWIVFFAAILFAAARVWQVRAQTTATCDGDINEACEWMDDNIFNGVNANQGQVAGGRGVGKTAASGRQAVGGGKRADAGGRRMAVLGGQFVGSDIGINLYHAERLAAPYPAWIRGIGAGGDSVRVSSDAEADSLLRAMGICAQGIDFYRYRPDTALVLSLSGNRTRRSDSYRLISLADIRERIRPVVKGDVIFMINKFFIMRGAEYYKLDSNFILHVDVVKSRDIESLKSHRPFTIIRISTNVAGNARDADARGDDYEYTCPASLDPNDPNDVGTGDCCSCKSAECPAVLDGVFVLSKIGVDMRCADISYDGTLNGRSVFPLWVKGIGDRGDSVYVRNSDCEVDPDGYVRRGSERFPYRSLGKLKCTGNIEFIRYRKENYTLLSLREIREKYFPTVKGDVVYMINKHFVACRDEYYKLDADFIHHVELVDSRDFESLRGRRPFHILRIFTRTRHNERVAHGRQAREAWLGASVTQGRK